MPLPWTPSPFLLRHQMDEAAHRENAAAEEGMAGDKPQGIHLRGQQREKEQSNKIREVSDLGEEPGERDFLFFSLQKITITRHPTYPLLFRLRLRSPVHQIVNFFRMLSTSSVAVNSPKVCMQHLSCRLSY